MSISCHVISPGVLIAAVEGRKFHCGDDGSKFIGMRRSFDAGRTWTRMKKLVEDDDSVSMTRAWPDMSWRVAWRGADWRGVALIGVTCCGVVWHDMLWRGLG